MKAFASDFDNTLYFHKREEKISKEDIKSIKKFQGKGHLFGICSGRSINGIKRDTKGLIDYDFYILSTGAYILDKDFNLIFKKNIKNEELYSIYDTYIKEVLMVVHANNVVYTFQEPMPFQVPISSPREVPGDIYGISMLAKTETEARRIVEEINASYEDLVAYVNVRSVDVVHKGISKGSGIKIIKEYYSIETMCGIGDSYNDVPMLEEVEYPYTFTYSPKNMQEKYIVVENLSEAIREQ